MNETLQRLQEEINHKQKLINRIKRAIDNAGKDDVKIKDISKEDMLELLNHTAGDDEFYDSEFEIVWCGYKCTLWYGATNHESITNAIQNSIEEDNE